MRFKISLLVGAFFVIFSPASLYGSVAEIEDESLHPRGGSSSAPACDAEGECPVAVEMSVLRRNPPNENDGNRDEWRIFGGELSEGEDEGSESRGD